MRKQGRIIREKLLYTMLILVVYVIGKSMPLYGIDVSVYLHDAVDAEELLLLTISGDIYQCSLFALGISPYMISSMLVQMIRSLKNARTNLRMSPKKMNRLTLGITVTLAVFMALSRVRSLVFLAEGGWLILSKTVAVLEMITGVLIILWLSERNKKYGIGGQTALIFVNILDGIRTSISMHSLQELILPLIISLLVLLVMVFMENTEFRIPLQRISIHNIYADKNYLAIKMNPIGVMPAMFATAFFMLPQLAVNIIDWMMPNAPAINWLQQNLILTKPLGIGIYIAILYFLTIGFSKVFLNPQEITEQFLKSGDSIVNIHAGEDTKRYLTKQIVRIAFLSATVMSICLGLPLYLQMRGTFEGTLVSLPSSVMMLTGIWCNLHSEIVAVRDLDAYKVFI